MAKNRIIERKGKFTRTIVFHPAFDKRNVDPTKNFGIHGMEMLFVLKGPKGAIQFLLYTSWQLPHIRKDFEERMRFESVSPCLVMPMAADIGYHSPKPMYEGQEARECDVLGGKRYYDGSSLRAQEPFDILVSKGLDALWKYLEDDYRERFPDKTVPWQE